MLMVAGGRGPARDCRRREASARSPRRRGQGRRPYAKRRPPGRREVEVVEITGPSNLS